MVASNTAVLPVEVFNDNRKLPDACVADNCATTLVAV
jgi:hypothetical protein